jgi:hypothetical protein
MGLNLFFFMMYYEQFGQSLLLLAQASIEAWTSLKVTEGPFLLIP